jgi:hypothetical protein
VIAGAAAHNVYTLAHPLVLTWLTAKNDAAANVTVEGVDYLAGKVQIAENLGGDNLHFKYWYTVAGTARGAIDSTTDKILKYEDITAMGTFIRSHKWSPNFMVLNPEEMADLIKDARFIDASQYGSAEPLLTGEVGKVGAMKLLATTNIPAGVVFCVDSTRAAYLVIKRNVDLKRWDNPRSDAVELYFYFEFAPKVVNADCIAIVYDCQFDANKAL